MRRENSASLNTHINRRSIFIGIRDLLLLMLITLRYLRALKITLSPIFPKHRAPLDNI